MGQNKLNEKNRAAFIEMAKSGDTDLQMAEKLGVTRKTLFNWREKDPELDEIIKEAKALSDQGPEASLRKRAMGYEYDSEKVFFDQKSGEIVRAPIKVHVAPDVTACIFWLKNRDPDRWREKQPGENDSKVTLEGEVKVKQIDIAERVAQLKGQK